MKRNLTRTLADAAFIAGTALLFLGCIATSYRSARTLEPGQVSIGGGYLQANNIETDEDEDPVQLVNLDFRASPGKQVDVGLSHSYDASEGGESYLSTVWGDVKVQLTNTDNELNTLTFSTGLMIGYAYHEKAKRHITTIPLILSFPLSEQFTPTLLYRHEFISEAVLPTESDELQHPRSFVALGVEYALQPPSLTKPTVKLGASVGTFNGLAGGDDSERGLTFNLGVSVDLPVSRTE